MPILRSGGFCSVINVHLQRRPELVENVELSEAAKEMANRFEYLIQSILLIGSLCIEVVKHKEKVKRVYAL